MLKPWDADAVKRLRENLRWTQLELANSIGTNRAAIIRWESGESVPRLKSQRKLDELAEG